MPRVVNIDKRRGSSVCLMVPGDRADGWCMFWRRYHPSDEFDAGTVRLDWDGRSFLLSVRSRGRHRRSLGSGKRVDWRRLHALVAEMNTLDGEALWLFVASGKMAERILKKSTGIRLTAA
jgi:YD repeat-containing protein